MPVIWTDDEWEPKHDTGIARGILAAVVLSIPFWVVVLGYLWISR